MSQEYHAALAQYRTDHPSLSHKQAVNRLKEINWKEIIQQPKKLSKRNNEIITVNKRVLRKSGNGIRQSVVKGGTERNRHQKFLVVWGGLDRLPDESVPKWHQWFAEFKAAPGLPDPLPESLRTFTLEFSKDLVNMGFPERASIILNLIKKKWNEDLTLDVTQDKAEAASWSSYFSNLAGTVASGLKNLVGRLITPKELEGELSPNVLQAVADTFEQSGLGLIDDPAPDLPNIQPETTTPGEPAQSVEETRVTGATTQGRQMKEEFERARQSKEDSDRALRRARSALQQAEKVLSDAAAAETASSSSETTETLQKAQQEHTTANENLSQAQRNAIASEAAYDKVKSQREILKQDYEKAQQSKRESDRALKSAQTALQKAKKALADARTTAEASPSQEATDAVEKAAEDERIANEELNRTQSNAMASSEAYDKAYDAYTPDSKEVEFLEVDVDKQQRKRAEAARGSGAAWSADLEKPKRVHNSNRKTKYAVATLMNQWEANVAARSEDARKELTDVEKTGQAFEKIAQWMDDKCEKQLKAMEEKLEKLTKTLTSNESTIYQLTKDLTEKSTPWGKQELVDIGLRWLEEKDKWVSKLDLAVLGKVNPATITREMYYQYFLGLGHKMVKALVLLAASLRYEFRELNAPAQKAFWDKWNAIIEMQASNNAPKQVGEIERAFKDLLPDPPAAAAIPGGEAPGLSELSETASILAQLPEGNWQRAVQARDLLLLTEFRAEETDIEIKLKAGQVHFEQSMRNLLQISQKQRGAEPYESPTPTSILDLEEVQEVRKLKTDKLQAELKDNGERLTLMNHLVGSIPRLMWVLYVDTDQFEVVTEEQSSVSGVHPVYEEQQRQEERQRMLNFKPILGGRQSSKVRQIAATSTKSSKYRR